MKDRSAIPFLVVMYVGAFLAGFNENLMNMGLMSIMEEFSIDSITAQWLVSGYMIVAALIVTTMAFMYRRFKLKPLFIVGSVFAIAGSGLGLFAANFAMVMAARLLQAIGFGMFIPMMMNSILRVVPKNKLGTFMAIGGCMISFGPAFAPIACGALVTLLGWRASFIVPFAGMICAFVLGLFTVKNFETSKIRLDLPSVLLSAVFLFGLSFGCAQLGTNLIAGLVALVVAIAALAIFVVRQGKIENPLMDMRPMERASFWPAALLVFLAMLLSFAMSVLLPLYFEGSHGMTALFAGLLILIPVFVNCFISLLGGRIMDKKGEWPLLPFGYALVTIGFVLMAVAAVGSSAALVVVGSVVSFIGVGFVFSPSQTAGLRTLPPRENPFGVALMTTMTQVAACIAPSLFIGVMSFVQGGAAVQGASIEIATAQGFAASIVVAAVFAFVGFVVAFVFARAAARRAAGKQKTEMPVEESTGIQAGELAAIMDASPRSLAAGQTVLEALQFMSASGTSGAPVVDEEGVVVGYISDGDIMRYLAEKHPSFNSPYSYILMANDQTIDEKMGELVEKPVGDICNSPALSLGLGASMDETFAMLSNNKIEMVPVVDADGRMLGTVNRANALQFAMSQYLGKALKAKANS